MGERKNAKRKMEQRPNKNNPFRKLYKGIRMAKAWRNENATSKSPDNEDSGVTPEPYLGRTLSELNMVDPSFDGSALPALLRYCIDYVEEYGLGLEGIYRVSSPKIRLDELERETAWRNHPLSYKIPPITDQFQEAHEAAGLLKRILRAFPDPIIPLELQGLAETCGCRLDCACDTGERMRVALKTLSPDTLELIAAIFVHAGNVVSNEHRNKMGIPAMTLLLEQNLNSTRRSVCMLLAGQAAGARSFFPDYKIIRYFFRIVIG
ncbi:unnamed protein product, partial [Mesorhabditis spiculigera]